MMIAKGSLRFILVPFILGVLASFYNFLAVIPFFIISLYFAWFFRDPKREIIYNKNILYAAADGMVKYIEKDPEGIKVAIRMSPFNVHLNRAPHEGSVTHIERTPGSHRSVYFAGAEERNEKNLIVIENPLVKTEVLQITGVFARRIECWVELDEQLKQSQRIGIIRFGSQTNQLMKLQDENKVLSLQVEKGDSVNAGVTPIAKIVDKND